MTLADGVHDLCRASALGPCAGSCRNGNAKKAFDELVEKVQPLVRGKDGRPLPLAKVKIVVTQQLAKYRKDGLVRQIAGGRALGEPTYSSKEVQDARASRVACTASFACMPCPCRGALHGRRQRPLPPAAPCEPSAAPREPSAAPAAPGDGFAKRLDSRL